MGKQRPAFQQMGITPEDTSAEPANYHGECLRPINQRVLKCIKDRGVAGASAQYVASTLHIPLGTASGRISELHKEGYIRATEAVGGNRERVYIAINKSITPPVKTYMVNEIFYSLQGEGARAGTANVFVRFAGCNLTCKVESHGFDCDTEFTSGRKLTALQIVEEMTEVAGRSLSVILTGGEPLLQVDGELITVLKDYHWYIAIETNGSLPVLAGIDWVTVSPKVAEHAIQQREADEVKYVRSVGQGIPKTYVRADYKFLSPAWGVDTEKNLAYCVQLIKENPEWRLSLQQHKLWNVR
jgi:7-carboxy-7-deazaguanine synthase